MSVLDDFKSAGMDASFHYADDTCAEWGLARKREQDAMRLYHDNPEHQEAMQKIAEGFLWYRDFLRFIK